MNISTGWAAETSIPVTFASTASFNFNLSVLKTNLPDDEALKNSAINFVICKTGTGLSRVNMTAQVTLPPVKNIVVTNTTPAADSSTFDGETCANCKTLKTRVQTLEEKSKSFKKVPGYGPYDSYDHGSSLKRADGSTGKNMTTDIVLHIPKKLIEKKYICIKKEKWWKQIRNSGDISLNSQRCKAATLRTFWHILAGGKRSKYGTLSESIHHADMYEIALLCGEMAPEYEELFAEVFELTVTAAIEVGS